MKKYFIFEEQNFVDMSGEVYIKSLQSKDHTAPILTALNKLVIVEWLSTFSVHLQTTWPNG